MSLFVDTSGGHSMFFCKPTGNARDVWLQDSEGTMLVTAIGPKLNCGMKGAAGWLQFWVVCMVVLMKGRLDVNDIVNRSFSMPFAWDVECSADVLRGVKEQPPP